MDYLRIEHPQYEENKTKIAVNKIWPSNWDISWSNLWSSHFVGYVRNMSYSNNFTEKYIYDASAKLRYDNSVCSNDDDENCYYNTTGKEWDSFKTTMFANDVKSYPFFLREG